MKLMIFIGITVFGTLGSWLGSLLDGGNWFGGWSILVGAIGSFFGLWIGYRIGRDYF